MRKYIVRLKLALARQQVNSKAAESLADPEEYPNLFEDWQVALSVEENAVKARYSYTVNFFPGLALSCRSLVMLYM